jgi:hypothetical protein
MWKSIKTMILALLLMGSPVFADTVCHTYPDDAGQVVGPLMPRWGGSSYLNASFSVEIVSGSGAVGSYQLQKADGNKFFNVGSPVNVEGITPFTPDSDRFQVVMITGPDPGTTVLVCLHL